MKQAGAPSSPGASNPRQRRQTAGQSIYVSNVYKARIDYRVTGAVNLISVLAGEAATKGSYQGGHLIPATFDLAYPKRH